MTATHLDPVGCALFLLTAFSVAGLCQAAWLASAISKRFAAPLDAGLTVRGRPIFGSNKTWRGVVVMVPATGASFALVARLAPQTSALAGLWPLSTLSYALLGIWAGLGFMAGELPNSFVKRQAGIAPGSAADGAWRRRLFLFVDHVDSATGALIVLASIVPVPPLTFLYVALAAPAVHGGFSALTYRLGGKERAA